MNPILQAGILKKSFELNFRGGTIWCEHLDGMGVCEEEVIRKLREDQASFFRPSVSSSMIINLDQTEITEKIADSIVTALAENGKRFRKIAFVGVQKHWRRKLVKIQENGCVIEFFTDYEKAKEWVLSIIKEIGIRE